MAVVPLLLTGGDPYKNTNRLAFSIIVFNTKRRYMIMGDPAQVWKGLRIMTDVKNKPSSVSSSAPSLADELNTFHARFETDWVKNKIKK